MQTTALVLTAHSGTQGDSKDTSNASGPSTKLLGGKDVIYTGKGSYVRDDARKYPSKTSMTGGFAGGERGVEQYVSDGEVQFDDESRPQVSFCFLIPRRPDVDLLGHCETSAR